MKAPTPIQIAAEIRTLTEMKPKVRKFTMFGDNNHDAIDAQIEALEDDFDESAIYDKEDSGDWTERQRVAAQEAIDWREGDTKDIPSKEWEPLVQK